MKLRIVAAVLFLCLLSTTFLLLAQNQISSERELKIPEPQKNRLVEVELRRTRILFRMFQISQEHANLTEELQKVNLDLEVKKNEAYKESGVKPEEFELDLGRMVFVKKQSGPPPAKQSPPQSEKE